MSALQQLKRASDKKSEAYNSTPVDNLRSKKMEVPELSEKEKEREREEKQENKQFMYES
jgi:hypothetical protein